MQESNAGQSRAMNPTEEQLQTACERDRQIFNIPYMLRDTERGYAYASCIWQLACFSSIPEWRW